MARSLRSVVAVSSDAEREEFLDALIVDANDYDVVFMESLASAPVRIRATRPELVVVLLDIGDAVACYRMALLKIECERLGIAVVTCASTSPHADIADVAALDFDGSTRRVAMRMN
jgi:hypothetical protein